MSNYEYPNELQAAELPVIAAPSAVSVEASSELRAHREKRFKLAFISSLLTRPLRLVIPALTVYLFAKPLGPARYGLFEAVGALVIFLGMTNLGLTMGLMNKLTDCYVSGDREQAQRYTSSLTLLLGAMLVTTMALWTLAIPLVNWERVFPIDDPIGKAERPWAVWAAGICMLIGLLTSLPGAVYSAYQEVHKYNIWEGIAKFVTLLACLLVAATHVSVVAVLLAVSGAANLSRLINLFWLFLYEKPWLRPRIRLFAWRWLKGVMSQGILLFVLELSTMLLFSLDKQVISSAKGVAAVTGYAIVGRIFIAAYGVFMLILMPLMPANGEAVRRGDIAWVRRSLRWSVLLGCGLPLLTGAGLLVVGGPLLRIWTRSDSIQVSRSVILALTFTFALRAWVDTRSITLSSMGILKPQIIFYTGHAVANLILAIALVGRFGVAGVAWSTPITALFTITWGYPYMMRRYIFSRESASNGSTPA